jgi:hypothetical protein
VAGAWISRLGLGLGLCLALAASCSDDAATGDSTDVDDGGAPFVDTPDGGGIAYECDLWAQDCPAGDKCMPWGEVDTWNATRCTPLASAPALPGEACTVEGAAASGIDDCALGSMCWDVDDAGEGTCVSLCTGSPDAPQCAAPELGCSVSNGGVLILCVPWCDPLVQDCPAGGACYPEARGFFCSPDASEDIGAYGDPCAYLNACDPGFWCAAQSDVPGCASEDGCCSEVCDASDPGFACAGEGQVCEAFWSAGTAPPGQAAFGLCVMPD